MKASIIHLNGARVDGGQMFDVILENSKFPRAHSCTINIVDLSRLCGLLPRISPCFFPTSRDGIKSFFPTIFLLKSRIPLQFQSHPAKPVQAPHIDIPRCFSRCQGKLSGASVNIALVTVLFKSDTLCFSTNNNILRKFVSKIIF